MQRSQFGLRSLHLKRPQRSPRGDKVRHSSTTDAARYTIKVGGMKRILKARVVPVRRLLVAVCDLLATGHDVHFHG